MSTCSFLKAIAQVILLSLSMLDSASNRAVQHGTTCDFARALEESIGPATEAYNGFVRIAIVSYCRTSELIDDHLFTPPTLAT
ncbi:uncharacterized protein EI97DRAFT_185542 [Westerdykella ornata]|uniref:Uncharacterized protein n=1 Tax=Westerdykella ornata TaxID=318751 RepID=A0A6A6JU13_WESOR|nr:uncharacterized protein EI97DRAFT_185542 [Westerdykella ornata]KAF2279735.1 hypothetical protein EI97DRAFT_185542 [Westerdykella ornata]